MEYVEELKILADINDPQVKRTFEDGQGKCPIGISMRLCRLLHCFLFDCPADHSF